MGIGRGTVVPTARTAGVGVATLAAGGSGFFVSRLRGLLGVAVARAGAAGAITAGAAGNWRGIAGGSAITDTLNGV